MLQRAASNAYSWWWASHIRTKQSKWLEQSLQDMEEKVQYVLKLIEEDGDSFAKRAEMYYKKRPELIHFVEESYRAFRALAERYDHLSTELQNANTTIASVFPEQVQFAMDDEEEYKNSARMQKNFPQGSAPNVPKVPKVPNRDLKGLLTTASKKLQAKKYSKTADKNTTVVKSGLSKDEALEEIDKLQKDILALQTVKEFVKSSYESGVAKYWGIENQIMEMQQKVSNLQDEFGVSAVIEDDEARTLMAEAALKSCQETLSQLQEKQDKYTQEAQAEYKRIEEARLRLKSLKHEFLNDQTDEDESEKSEENSQSLNQEVGDGLEVLRDKIKEQIEVESKGSLTVTELAENIDQLVNKVINLESAVSSQTALIDGLKTETDDLQAHIRSLEDDKATLIDGTQDLSKRLREMEEKLHGVQDLNQNVENQNTNLQTHFTEARCSLDHLSEKLQNVKPDEELEVTVSSRGEELDKPKEEGEDKNEQNLRALSLNNQVGDNMESERDQVEKQDLSQTVDSPLNVEPRGFETDKEEELNWQQMLLSGVEDKEKILLAEYTTILKNYKELKKRLSDVEKNKQDSLFETMVQLRELKSTIAKRDHEIHSLRQKLNLLQENLGEDTCDDRGVNPEAGDSDGNGDLEIKLILVDQPQTIISRTEEKLRMNIDGILDENLDFWLRFSTAFHQVQKFRTEVQDLQGEISELRMKEIKRQEGKSNTSMFTTDLKSDVRAIYKHLSEIQTELTVWLEQSALLKDELQRRFSSLCNIQEEITMDLKEGVEEDIIQFSSHQAAKFQGEVLNMKQENNKVSEELQAGLDHVSALQLEIEKTLAKLDEEFGISESNKQNQLQLRHSTSRSRIPLRSFIFGFRQKKQRQSIFACMHNNRKLPDPRPSLPM